jgi:hypothetical protein
MIDTATISPSPSPSYPSSFDSSFFWPFACCLYLIQLILYLYYHLLPIVLLASLLLLVFDTAKISRSPSPFYLSSFWPPACTCIMIDTATISPSPSTSYSSTFDSSFFWPFVCCLYLIQRASKFLVIGTVISLFWASTQLASLWNIILPATLSIRASRIFLDCLIPPNPFQFGYA